MSTQGYGCNRIGQLWFHSLYQRSHTTIWCLLQAGTWRQTICWLAIWTSIQCHNPEPAPAARMLETSVLGRCSKRLVAIFTTLSFRQECHFSVSCIFLQLFCKNCLHPLTHSSLLTLDSAYHPVGDHLLQRHLLKLVWIQVWSSENSAEHYINLQNIRFYVSVPILKHSAFLGQHLRFSFFSFSRGQLSSPKGFEEPAGPEGKGLAQGKGHHPMHLQG